MYQQAHETYAQLGVDTDAAIEKLLSIPISIHCWQGDDVGGFENPEKSLGGGLAVTGNYPGKSRTPDELRADFEKAISLIPGTHRINLHAIYGEFAGKKVDRDAIETTHFQNWIDWAKSIGIGMDFNPSCFGHPKSGDGFTLTHVDESIRSFWIEHCKRTRTIAADIGRQLGRRCVNNVWIPDGMKDTPVDRFGPRQRLLASLDKIFETDLPSSQMADSVEGKLFGIGAESYTVGMHEFYLGYAISRKKMVCVDAGHYHPTEHVGDKLSSVLSFSDEVLMHVSRGVRWDSDHVITLDDQLISIAQEIVRPNFIDRVNIGLDFFDASIHRVAAWVIGVRNMQKALLAALLEPIELLKKLEEDGDYTARLAMLEELKTLPMGAVWDEACRRAETPVGRAWLADVKAYERDVTSKRS